MFRSRNHFRVPALKLWPVVIFVLAVVVIGGLVMLAVVEPTPPMKHFEVPVTKG
jgi:hypothetical protein